MLTIALATLRAHWAAFAGTLAALALGVSVIATMAVVASAASASTAYQRPERFAAVRFVIRADPAMTVHDLGGTDTVPFLQQPDVPAAALRQLPGTIPDRSFYAQVLGVEASQPALGHGWSAAAFAPYTLTSGHPPRSDDQIVVAGRAALGRRVAVVTANGMRLFTIVGTVRPRVGEQPIFFTNAEAARLSPGIDALVTGNPATARRAAHIAGLEVLTGTRRHQADPQAVPDGTELTGLTTFLGVTALIAAFVAVSVTASAFALSVAQRRRELALLRTVGATPRQIMRMVCAEAALVGTAGSLVGCVLGVVWAPALATWIARKGLAPVWFSARITPGSIPALVIVFLAGVGIAVLSVFVAARRAGTVRPTEALREAAVEPAGAGRLRRLAGLACVICGIAALCVVAAVLPSAATEAETQAELAILLVGGAALLSPWLLAPLTRPLGHGTTAMLVRANIITSPRRAAAAIAPVLIAVGLSASILGANDTTNAALSSGLHAEAAGANYVVLPGPGAPGLSMALVNRIHAVRGTEATAVTQTNLLAYQPALPFHLQAPMPVPFPALGIDRPSSALNLHVLAGSLAHLSDHTIAVDASWNLHVGEVMKLWRPDGMPVSLTVIAVLDSGLSGPSLVVDLHNADIGMPSLVYVKTHTPATLVSLRAAAQAEHARVVPISRWSASVTDQQTEQNEVGLEVLLGIAIAYSAIGIANAFLMSTSGRKRELRALHLAGATWGQIARIVAAESLTVTLAGTVLSAGAAGLLLGGLTAALLRQAPTPLSVPWMLLGLIVAGSTLIAVTAAVLPAMLQMVQSRRRSPQL
jgi:putative ABC transport system permease protein